MLFSRVYKGWLVHLRDSFGYGARLFLSLLGVLFFFLPLFCYLDNILTVIPLIHISDRYSGTEEVDSYISPEFVS